MLVLTSPEYRVEMFMKEDGKMPTYVSLLKLTEKGIADIKNTPERLKAAKKGVEAMGGKWVAIYAVLGEYDYVAITEFPSDEAGMMFALAIGSAGNIRTTTLKAVTEKEFVDIVKKLP